MTALELGEYLQVLPPDMEIFVGFNSKIDIARGCFLDSMLMRTSGESKKVFLIITNVSPVR